MLLSKAEFNCFLVASVLARCVFAMLHQNRILFQAFQFVKQNSCDGGSGMVFQAAKLSTPDPLLYNFED